MEWELFAGVLENMNCPKCNGTHTAEIAYGYPGDIEEYLKLVAEKKIFPGGCTFDNDSPSHYCFDCKMRFGCIKSNDDSFDYDQGFNLDEVYD